MFAASAIHTNKGAKQFVEDRPIEVRRFMRRGRLVAQSEQWHRENREKAERQRRWQAEVERARALAMAKREEAARHLLACAEAREPTAQALSRRIIAQVAAWHGLTYSDIIGPGRTAPLVLARQDAMVAVDLAVRARGTTLSLPALGRIFKRDHTTLLHSLRKRGVR